MAAITAASRHSCQMAFSLAFPAARHLSFRSIDDDTCLRITLFAMTAAKEKNNKKQTNTKKVNPNRAIY